MTFLEYFNLSKGEKQSASTNTGSLSNNSRTHRHQNSSYGVRQLTGKTKKVNGVARYLFKKDDDINRCIRSGQDIPISIARAMELRKYGTPTKEEPEKAINKTNVYIVLNPDGSYKLTFKGDQHGNSKVLR